VVKPAPLARGADGQPILKRNGARGKLGARDFVAAPRQAGRTAALFRR
jgi:hypothetical protein